MVDIYARSKLSVFTGRCAARRDALFIESPDRAPLLNRAYLRLPRRSAEGTATHLPLLPPQSIRSIQRNVFQEGCSVPLQPGDDERRANKDQFEQGQGRIYQWSIRDRECFVLEGEVYQCAKYA